MLGAFAAKPKNSLKKREVLPPTVNRGIKGQEMRVAGGLTSSWVKNPYYSVFPASQSPNKLIGSWNPGHDGGLVGRRILPTLERRQKNGPNVCWGGYFQG